jgi:polyisoprenoid-binding protein YceI
MNVAPSPIAGHSPAGPAAPALPRRAVLFGAAAAMLTPAAFAQPLRYVFDQRGGAIEFTAHHIGLLSSTGRFTKFDAEVQLDSANATQAAVDVTVDTGSIALEWPGAQDLLRSPAYFDSARFPTAHFKGTTIGAGGLERFAIKGELTMRGVTRPFDMQGKLLGRKFVPALGADVAEFSAGGALSRSEFGMTADQLMTGDQVRIDVRVKIQLGTAQQNG